MGCERGEVAADAGRPHLCCIADGLRERTGQISELDRATGAGRESPAGRLRICAVQLRTDRSTWQETTMNAPVSIDILKQHLIDPEICIRCNTCEETCPIDAITHDENNYVVKADTCNGCMACVPPCPTGAIDNWRTVLKGDAYPIEEQFRWDVLPEQNTMAVPVAEDAEAAAGSSDD